MKESATPDIEIVRPPDTQECVETFAWNHLRFHVVTRDPLTTDQVRTMRKALRKIDRVGRFAELVAMILGRHVQIRTVRPSPDIRFEIGL
jgi:hypothetical protein